MDNSLKDRVLETVDIVEVIGERVRLQRKGHEFVGLCPFHADHKPSLCVSPKKRIFKCFSCGAGGDVIHFVQKLNRVEFREALMSLAQRAGITTRSSPEDQRAHQLRDRILSAVAWAQGHFRRNLEATEGGRSAREYARRRGLTPETIDRFDLGFAADAWDDLLSAARRATIPIEVIQPAGLVATNDSGRTYDRFRNRLVFPIRDTSGRPIAFGGRALGDDPAKYLNSPETVLFSKSRVLYGLDHARRAIEQENAVIVVEGYMDAVLLSQYGFENTVATLGVALTGAHAKLLGPLAKRIYLCFDSDDAGVRAADRAVELALCTQAEVRVVMLDGDKDPADCVVSSGADGFRTQLTQAADALQFKWSQILKSIGTAGSRNRRVAVESFVSFVANASIGGGLDPLEQDLLVGRLSELLAVPPEEVFGLLSSARRLIRRRAPEKKEHGPEDSSAYDLGTRGLPGALITAMETVLGLLQKDPRCWAAVDETAAQAAELSETWRLLYGLLLEVHHDLGEYSQADVLSRCDDGATCELVARASARVQGVTDAFDAFPAARERLASELEVLRMGDLRNGLRGEPVADSTEDAVYRSLLEMARRQHSVLPTDRRWNAAVS